MEELDEFLGRVSGALLKGIVSGSLVLGFIVFLVWVDVKVKLDAQHRAYQMRHVQQR